MKTIAIKKLTYLFLVITILYSIGCDKDDRPLAEFSADKISIATGETIKFTDKSTNYPIKWKWDFGDGLYSILQNPEHIYTLSGSYTVSLEVRNQDGKDVNTKVNLISVCKHKLWDDVYTFEKDYWTSNLIMTDSLNIWLVAQAIFDIRPIPDLPIIIIRSTDGGNTWTKYEIAGTNKLRALQLNAINNTTAWLNIFEKGLYKTTDGGVTWSKLTNSYPFDSSAVMVHFFDENEGVGCYYKPWTMSVNDSLFIIKTYDGGYHWDQLPQEKLQNRRPGELFNIYGNGLFKCIGDTIAFPTDCGRVYMSFNRGDDWSPITFSPYSPYETIMSMSMVNSKTFAITSPGKYSIGDANYTWYNGTKVLATTNKGNSWSITPIIPLFSTHISIIPGKCQAYVLSNYSGAPCIGGTYISTDFGVTFTEIDEYNKNVGVAAFYSVYHGFGATFNYNTNPSASNKITKWNYRALKDYGVNIK